MHHGVYVGGANKTCTAGMYPATKPVINAFMPNTLVASAKNAEPLVFQVKPNVMLDAQYPSADIVEVEHLTERMGAVNVIPVKDVML